MPLDPLKLQALTMTAIRDATTAYLNGGTQAAWEQAMRAAITRGHTAAYLAATAERLNVPLDSALLSEKRLSRAERAEIKRLVQAQIDYLRGFIDALPTLTDAQIAARADLYAGAVKTTYYQTRWGDWEIPDHLLPGMQQCVGNCKCRISVADNGDGSGVLTRTMGGTEHHCTECPPLVGDHPVRRRGA